MKSDHIFLSHHYSARCSHCTWATVIDFDKDE
jgi:hypothetical protein